MKNKNAFTLIELLVVVLIIGILSAIALPQYEKAVEKSRMAEAQLVLRSLIQAQETYFLTNGQYTNNLEELDVRLPSERIGKADVNKPLTYMYSCDKLTGCTAAAADEHLPTLIYTGNSSMTTYNSRSPLQKEYLRLCMCVGGGYGIGPKTVACGKCKELSNLSDSSFGYYNQYLYILP